MMQAQVAYESAIKQARDLHNTSQAAPPSILSEYQVWEEHWCHCAQELGQWDTLNDFGKSQNGANPFLGTYIHKTQDTHVYTAYYKDTTELRTQDTFVCRKCHICV